MDKERMLVGDRTSVKILIALATVLLILHIAKEIVPQCARYVSSFVIDPRKPPKWLPEMKNSPYPYQTCRPDPDGQLLPSVADPSCYAGGRFTSKCQYGSCAKSSFNEDGTIDLTLYYNPCYGTLKQFWQEWANVRMELEPSGVVRIREVDINATKLKVNSKNLPLIVKSVNGRDTVYSGRLSSHAIANWVIMSDLDAPVVNLRDIPKKNEAMC